VIGFMLSPLSWWNDAVVNLPWRGFLPRRSRSFINQQPSPNSKVFDGLLIFGYWLTNVLGFVLMHKGAQKILSKEEKKILAARVAAGCGSIADLYGADCGLIKTGVLKPIGQYFGK